MIFQYKVSGNSYTVEFYIHPSFPAFMVKLNLFLIYKRNNGIHKDVCVQLLLILLDRGWSTVLVLCSCPWTWNLLSFGDGRLDKLLLHKASLFL